jgi:hypothetical protein
MDSRNVRICLFGLIGISDVKMNINKYTSTRTLMLVELTNLLQISRMVWALLLSQTQTDRIPRNVLETRFSTRIFTLFHVV